MGITEDAGPGNPGLRSFAVVQLPLAKRTPSDISTARGIALLRQSKPHDRSEAHSRFVGSFATNEASAMALAR
ncbi:MAG TPA: hypothetical protein VGZ47_09100 [Gemmataceae bacterium]|jgi:hypothetical protein|nr:hypothetical protein [Gemmataceae bacterium]